MCIVIDANAAGDLARPTADGEPVLKWLLNRRRNAGLIVGGRLLDELVAGGLRETLPVLAQAGRLHRVPRERVEHLVDGLAVSGECRSNDHHVLAVVIASGCDLVFTKDQRLHEDLKNRRIVPNRPRIYKTAKRHARLLKACSCAPLDG